MVSFRPPPLYSVSNPSRGLQPRPGKYRQISALHALCQTHKALPYCPPLPLRSDISRQADRPFTVTQHRHNCAPGTQQQQQQEEELDRCDSNLGLSPATPLSCSAPRTEPARIFSTMDRSPRCTAACRSTGELQPEPQSVKGPPCLGWTAPRPGPWGSGGGDSISRGRQASGGGEG